MYLFENVIIKNESSTTSQKKSNSFFSEMIHYEDARFYEMNYDSKCH